MKAILIYLGILQCFALSVNGLKLLCVFPLPARSHYILGNELAKGLANLGHEVTIIAAFEENNPPKGYRSVWISEIMEFKEASGKQPNMFEMENMSPFLQMIFLPTVTPPLSEMIFNSTKVKALLNSNESFDAVIVEQFFIECMTYIPYHFKAPLILFSTIGANRWINNLVANPANPSYIPDILLSFGSDMTFYERLYNFVFDIASDLVLYQYVYPKHNTILHKYFPNAPHLSKLQYNASLVLLNSHESINQAVPHVPNMIDIGGFHVNPPKELPEDLKDFMDNAKEGVIYFSLGSNLVPSNMPQEKKNIILKVLGSRKEKILWKWNEDQLENKPSNVMISKWFPQQAILAHPKCKLFISHGGLLSTIETVSLGIPVLAFPIYGDQKLNAKRIDAKGFGIAITFSQITEQGLRDALEEVLDNPKYLENAKLASRIIHDRPIKPIELADYWIKYVVRHKGASHLRVAGLDLPLYKYYMLDVLACVFGGIALLALLLSKLSKKILKTRSIMSQSKQKKN
ncbi:unnamed protein product [Ceutorhynchus assimilis]|uniref:UDP-glucuronosyltransferase n=1 Tax=Ceutorhynchus assimilis TaxID=467358 RepID=A0A9N9MB95_9CUCU|nr:unnamed protein product [Ceutorhynchus assimilis]